MKRLIALLVALMMLLALCACGNNAGDSSNTNTESTNQAGDETTSDNTVGVVLPENPTVEPILLHQIVDNRDACGNIDPPLLKF